MLGIRTTRRVNISYMRVSSTWLSDDMALALAATAPALTLSNVTHAADQLTVNLPPSLILSDLLRGGANLFEVRTIVEALDALRAVA